jgi:flagellar hook-length control protein FliK
VKAPTKKAAAGANSGKSDPKAEKADQDSADPQQALNPDAESDDPGNEEPGAPLKGEKPTKKVAAKAAAVDPDVAAIVQLQGDKPDVTAKVKATPVNGKTAPSKTSTDQKVSAAGGVTALDPQADAGSANAPSVPPQLALATNGEDVQDPLAPKAKLAIQPKQAQDSKGDANASDVSVPQAQGIALPDSVVDVAAVADGPSTVDAATTAPRSKASSLDNQLMQGLAQDPLAKSDASGAPGKVATPGSNLPAAAPEAQFTAANHANIVSGIQTKLLPDGGTMNLRLDPPELGALQVRVEMKGGVMTASFETSNDQTAKLLSHSLTDLKTSLEAQGVTVEKLHVTQTPKEQTSSGDSSQGKPDSGGDSSAQREQQRKEMMQRMWRKLMGQDPVDLVA